MKNALSVRHHVTHSWVTLLNSHNNFMGSSYYTHCVDKEIGANKDYTGAREMPWTGRETLEDCAAVHGVRLDCRPFCLA